MPELRAFFMMMNGHERLASLIHLCRQRTQMIGWITDGIRRKETSMIGQQRSNAFSKGRDEAQTASSFNTGSPRFTGNSFSRNLTSIS